MMEVVGLTKIFQSRRVLDGVSFRFEPGQATAVVGPSGGGKSTFLRCLNGLETFDEGQVHVGEHALRAGSGTDNRVALRSIRLRVGFVFQQWHLFAHRTALGNVVEGPVHVKGMAPREASDWARSLLAKVGMGHRADAYPSELSGGEQQRVAIARALAMEPTALLLDEPTSALDPERVTGVTELLARLVGDGLTVIVVTHEMRFARAVSSHLVVLHSGHIVESGSTAQILESPSDARTRAFLGMEAGGG